MEQNEDIELQLWEYIDGICSEADRQRIAALVTSDNVWRQKFRELRSLNASLSQSMETEHPSMRFSKNVMEAVAATHIAPATTKYINNHVIRGIAAFFIIAIVALIGYAIASVNWRAETTFTFPRLQINLSSIFNSSYVNIIIAINIVLGLIFLDFFLRKKGVHS